jgi:hypothetical protein
MLRAAADEPVRRQAAAGTDDSVASSVHRWTAYPTINLATAVHRPNLLSPSRLEDARRIGSEDIAGTRP